MRTRMIDGRHALMTSVCALAFIACAVHAGGLADEVHKVVSNVPFVGQGFGYSVDVNGNRAIIGAPGRVQAGGTHGEAYIVNVDTGAILHRVEAHDIAPHIVNGFGLAVAITGNTALVGAPLDKPTGGNTQAGAVYAYDMSNGQFLYKLTSSDTQAYAGMGFSIAVTGDIAVFGAPGDDGAVHNDGAVYVFDLASLRQLHRLVSTHSPAATDQFGTEVGIGDNYICAGGDGNVVQVFDRATYQHVRNLTPNVTTTSFGRSMAVDGDRIIVGRNKVFIFDLHTGDQLLELLPTGTGTDFGAFVDLKGDRAAVSRVSNSSTNAGDAFLFDSFTGALLVRYQATDQIPYDIFTGIALGGRAVVVGCPEDTQAAANAGAAYIFNGQCASVLAGDLNWSCTVDVGDLFQMLAAWGACGVCDASCGADIAGASGAGRDCEVNVYDLFVLLANWTP